MAETGDELPRKNALMRHLTRTQASFTLRRGRQVDQFLGREQLPDDNWAIRWLSISPTDYDFVTRRHHVEDINSSDVAERRVPFFKVDKFIQFDSTDINQWIENRRVI